MVIAHWLEFLLDNLETNKTMSRTRSVNHTPPGRWQAFPLQADGRLLMRRTLVPVPVLCARREHHWAPRQRLG